MFRPAGLTQSVRKAGEKGFTLIELMITLLILGLIMGVVYRVFSSQEKFFRTQEQVSAMQENLRATVEYINQEMSWLGYKVPGLAVIKAAPGEVIFKANIPNTGSSIQFVRYQFSPTLNTISRAAGAYTTDIENVDLAVMATDIEAVSFSYYNVLNGQVVTDAADPLCAGELPVAVCAPGDPDDDASLLMIQRLKARVTARTSRPDWSYTDPAGGANPNYRKRAAVLDLRARNVEDVTLHGGQIGLGQCGYLTHTINIPQNPYVACRDLISQINFGTPDMSSGWSDNPSITIQAYDMNGNINTNPNRVVYVYGIGADETPFNIYDSADPYTVENTIDSGETRYLAAQELSGVTSGNRINIQFAYTDGICTQQLYDGNLDIFVAPDTATHFDTSGPYVTGGLSVGYVDLGTGSDLGLPSPVQVAMCSTASSQGISLQAQLLDDCTNPITGETITWDDGGAGGSFVDQSDNGDGTYSATYVPPDTMLPTAATYGVSLNAHWGTVTLTTGQTLIAAEPYDIVMDSITDITQAGIFNFSSMVPPRASQLGGSTGSSFSIERIDGQEIGVRFHIEDACGNWVLGEGPNVTVSTSTLFPATPLASNPDGSYSFAWEWGGGCGGGRLGENITINVSSITNPSTKSEIIAFDLPETLSSNPDSGPFLVMDQDPVGSSLQAGNTSDSVIIKATVTQYDPAQGYCTNIPGVFPVEFTVAGDAGGNGSFIFVNPFDDTVETVDTDAGGLAQVNLYSGTADWDDSLALTAIANIDGATYSGNIAVSMQESTIENTSGIYQNSSYVTEIGSDQAVTAFNPGDYLYIQIFDYDENEDPLVKDSLTGPFDVEVTIQSALTGDLEVLGLTEWAENVAQFRRSVETQFSPVSTSGDGVLQTRDGDTVTVYYEDKDTPGDNHTWTVETFGADSFRVYRVDPPPETELVNPGPTQAWVRYGDHIRPKLSFPYLAGDGRIEVDTVEIEVDSADEVATLVMREEGDSGVMIPDWTIYTGDYFTVAQTDPGPDVDVLLTPTTPRYVTLTYDEAGSYTEQVTFFMRDFDLPTVTITQPANGQTVSGEVTVLVDANDVGNATSWGGIGRIELYVNGRMIDSVVGADLTGVNTFTWTTANGLIPYWLDGGHTITAVAYDTSLNQALPSSVDVTVENNLSSIEFTKPDYGDYIWSMDVDIELSVSMAAEAGTYQVVLAESGGMGAVLTSWTAVGDSLFSYLLPAAGYSDGAYGLVATLMDADGKLETTAYDPLIFDRMPPDVVFGSPLDQPWIGIGDFGLFQVTVSDANGVSTGSVTGTFGGICSSGSMPMTPGSGDSYTLNVPNPDTVCANAEGLMEFTVDADDVANLPNHASVTKTVMVDTVKPTVDTFDVLPWVDQSFTMDSVNLDGFIRGDVTLSATVTDSWPTSGVFLGLYYNDPWNPVGPPDGTQFRFPPASALDASSGSFSYAWTTTFQPDGIWVLGAGVLDAAGNSSDSSPTKILYLDNEPPQVDAPMVDAPTGVYEDLVYVQVWAWENHGFLREIIHSFIDSTTGTVVHTETMTFTAEEKVRNFQTTYVLDLSGWSEGVYRCESVATDWAGNTNPSSWVNTFEILPLVDQRELDAVTPIAAKVTFSPVATGLYTATVAGGHLVDGLGNPVPGEEIWVDLYHAEWDSLLSEYQGFWVDSRLVTTDPAGQLPAAAFTTEIFGETDAARVEYYHNMPWQELGSIRAVLGSPMIPVFPWFQFFEGPLASMVDNLDLEMTDAGGTHFTLRITGDLVRSNGDPVAGADMRIHSWHEEPVGSGTWIDQDFTDTTGPGGGFLFDYPSDNLIFPYDTWVSIEFFDDNDEHLGSIQWDPWDESWDRWFH